MHRKIDMTQRAYSLINTISAPLHAALYNRRDYAVASATAESNRIEIPDTPVRLVRTTVALETDRRQ